MRLKLFALTMKYVYALGEKGMWQKWTTFDESTRLDKKRMEYMLLLLHDYFLWFF